MHQVTLVAWAIAVARRWYLDQPLSGALRAGKHVTDTAYRLMHTGLGVSRPMGQSMQQRLARRTPPARPAEDPGKPKIAASCTRGWLSRTRSTLTGEMLDPPRMIISCLLRPRLAASGRRCGTSHRVSPRRRDPARTNRTRSPGDHEQGIRRPRLVVPRCLHRPRDEPGRPARSELQAQTVSHVDRRLWSRSTRRYGGCQDRYFEAVGAGPLN
jgi:hypothetical protein